MGIEFFTGLILGTVLAYVFVCICSSLFCSRGKFIIDFTDPNKDVCRLEIDDIERTYKKKLLVLKVVTGSKHSQE